ncbi:MAG: enoyl-CoA hydratase/isomerase family protein [Firmicutes bacterium]|nr:enoyl-CoA hydratase/isomerase family protein [Bacillota bacterium]
MDEVRGLQVTNEAGVLDLLLDDPGRLNPLTPNVIAALTDVLIASDRARQVHCAILHGAGRAFTAGGDAREVLPALQGEQGRVNAVELMRLTDRLLLVLSRVSFPVITVVHGWVAGAGLGVTGLSDWVIAETNARFHFNVLANGLLPDSGLVWTLVQNIGLLRTKQLLFSRETLTAEQAESIGLACEVVADGDGMGAAQKRALAFVNGPFQALRTTKRMIHTNVNLTLEQALEFEQAQVALQLDSAEAREGLAAFAEKRTAQFPVPKPAPWFK